ncbi:hypothetical protein BDF19DRAFT_455948 [Syncephalis fuscata]|nr:hypothetical protein BDF19DRAFT_455948 [Syncephalis fuscata]
MSDEDKTVVLMAREAIMDDEDEFDREEAEEDTVTKKKPSKEAEEDEEDEDEDAEFDSEDEDALDRELEQDHDDFIVDDDEEEEEANVVRHRRHRRHRHRRHRADSGDEDEDNNEHSETEQDNKKRRNNKLKKINDDDEEDEEVNSDNSQDEVNNSSDNEHERRRHRKLKRRKKHYIQEDEDLDDEDLELINENLGLKTETSDSHLRRIKKGRRDRQEERPRQRQVDLDTLFEDQNGGNGGIDEHDEHDEHDMNNRNDHHRHRGFADELDDFIQDDTDEDNDGRENDTRAMHHRDRGASQYEDNEGDNETAEGREANRRSRPRTGGYGDAVDDMADVFGHDYEWALDEDDEEGGQGYDNDLQKDGYDEEDYYESGGLSSQRGRRRRRTQLKDVFEPSELETRMMTEEDDEIRLRDVPERLQMLRGDEVGRPLSDAELAAETLFITSRMRESFPRDLSTSAASEMVKSALVFINRDNLEVLYIDRYKRDYFEQQPNASSSSEGGLNQSHLWRILDLDTQWRQLRRRRDQLKAMLARLDTPDLYAEDLYQRSMETSEDVFDMLDYVRARHGNELAEKRLSNKGEESNKAKQQRAASGNVWKRAMNTPIMALVAELGIQSRQFADNYEDGAKRHHADDPTDDPTTVAQRYVCSMFPQAEFALKAAKEILARQIAVDPTVRHSLRRRFEHDAIVNVRPTEKGRNAIDETHAWYPFKYLRAKPLRRFEDAQFLEVLQAERSGLDNVSETADKWNTLRRDILKQAFDKLLLPAMAKWARDWLRGKSEEYITTQVNNALSQKFGCAPKWIKDTRGREDRLARVLAVSWGHGDIKRDPIHMAFVDERGRLLASANYADLRQDEFQREFMDLCSEHKPDLVLVAGFNVSTRRLKDQVFQLVNDFHQSGRMPEATVAFADDDTARLYMESPRAKEEFPDLFPLTRYCIAVARRSQRPIEEYCALESGDLIALQWHPKQNLLPKDKLNDILERGLCEAVSKVGVDLIRATESPAQARMLSYGITKRSDLLLQRILTKTIFINCAAYLRIVPSRDILDTTRIHPSHYDLARKMAADALDVDDPHDEYGQPSEHVREMMTSRQTYRLDELILEDYAKELERVTGEPLYRILVDISQEIKQPFRELQRTWHEPPLNEVFERLTGETQRSLHVGVIVMARITKVQRDYANAQLESGLDGLIMRNNANETEPLSTQDILRPGENLQAAVIKVEQERFLVELSLRQSDIDQARHTMKYEAVDPAFDRQACEHDEAAAAETRARTASASTRNDRRQPKRTIQHPLFRNVTAAAAEAYLDRRHVGDCIIRPSYSRGSDHMVVVWKVHDGIYKHIEIVEQQLTAPGRQKRVFKVGDHIYSDLDEMVVLHVEAMTAKAAELREHQRFRTEADLTALHTWILARFQDNPKQFLWLLAPVDWEIDIIPDGFRLNRTEYVSVMDLINGFKAQVTNAMKRNKTKQPTQSAQRSSRSKPHTNHPPLIAQPSISTSHYHNSSSGGSANTNMAPPPPPPMAVPSGGGGGFYGHPVAATTAYMTQPPPPPPPHMNYGPPMHLPGHPSLPPPPPPPASMHGYHNMMPPQHHQHHNHHSHQQHPHRNHPPPFINNQHHGSRHQYNQMPPNQSTSSTSHGYPPLDMRHR